MKINAFSAGLLFLVLSVLSCRVAPENDILKHEDISLKQLILIKINLLRVEYNDKLLKGGLISENYSFGGG